MKQILVMMAVVALVGCGKKEDGNTGVVNPNWPSPNQSATDTPEPSTEFLETKAKAESGDADAQFYLGFMYGMGKGVEHNYVTAYAWASIAATNGATIAPRFKSEFLEPKMTPAQIAKAEELVKEMVKKNPKPSNLPTKTEAQVEAENKAFAETKPKAEAGDVDAQFYLGVMYATGQGVEQDFKEAVKWYQKAADQGLADAQFNLGVMFYNGQGVEQNFKEAFKWYQKAADQGDKFAQYKLGFMYANGQGVEQDFKETFKWYQKAADQGDAIAQNNLGSMYYKGQGVEQDLKEAFEWYQKAADQGDADAQNNLGLMYEKGEGVEQDFKKAVKWCQKAADQGNANAQYGLGVMYYIGLEVEQDKMEGIKWLRKAAGQGQEKAQEALEGIPDEQRLSTEEIKDLLKDLSLQVKAQLDELVDLNDEIQVSTATFGSLFKNLFKKPPYKQFSLRAKDLESSTQDLRDKLRGYQQECPYAKDDGMIWAYYHSLDIYTNCLKQEAISLADRQKLFYDCDKENPLEEHNFSFSTLTEAQKKYDSAVNKRVEAGDRLCRVYELLFPNEKWPR